MPILLPTLLNFQGSAHLFGVGSFSTLLENGVTADDERLVYYARFKSDIRKYEVVVQAKEDILEEIDCLYALSNKVEEIYQEENGTAKAELQIDSTSVQNSNSLSQDLTEDKDTWVRYWRGRLNTLKSNYQKLCQGGLNVEDTESLIESIEERERLYLSDLNDLERSFSLLFGVKPKHPYKIMLVFSFCFSFGIDLFSVLMSCLLYLFRDKRENE